jgi:subtilisin-like proprotein convertase family protein
MKSASFPVDRRFHVGLVALLACVVAALVATVTPAGATVVSNTGPITVPAAVCAGVVGQATPYPSTISVSGQTGTISDLNVTLHNVNSDYGGDLEVLLVSPAGATSNLLLLSDAGQGPTSPVTNVTFTFDDGAASNLPQNNPLGGPNSTVTAKPTNYAETTADTFPSPAPAPSSINTTLAAFNGLDPNGTWSLYVVDDACGNDVSDTISGGWSLDITTSSAVATSTSVASSPNPSTTGQTVTFTATVTSTGPVTAGTVTFREGVTTLAANVAVNSSGQAAFTTSALAEGNHVITATYNGTVSFATSSDSVNQRVDNATVVTDNQYCNTGAIAVNPLPNPATPYPSNITVSGVAANLGDITVTLKNVSHRFPDDIDVLLVGPAGQNLVLLSDAGPGASSGPDGASNVTVTFDDAAANQLPQNAPWALAGSTIRSRPVDYDPEGAIDVFPAPAPAPSTATTLSAFDGSNPNGKWSLYVVSDNAPDSGTIAGGWCVTLTASDTTPPSVAISQAVGQADPTAVSPVNFSATFSEPVSGFTGADVSFTGSTAGGTLVATVTGGPTTYNVAVSGMTTAGNVVISVPAGAAADLSGNPSLASTHPDNTVGWQPPATVATQVTPASGAAVTGDPVLDTATVTGVPGGLVPTGTVTFTRFFDGPGATPCSGPSTVFGPVALTPSNPATTPPSATASTAPDPAPATPGTIRFVASYSGDANYAAVSISVCGTPHENVTVTLPTSPATSLTCTPGTSGGGAADVCTVRDGDGVRTVLVMDTTANTQVFPPLTFTCPGAPTSTQFTVPANTKYKVFVTDCNTPRVKTSFVIRADGTVRGV